MLKRFFWLNSRRVSEEYTMRTNWIPSFFHASRCLILREARASSIANLNLLKNLAISKFP